MHPSSTADPSPTAVGGTHRRRPFWRNGKFLALFMALALLLGGAAVILPQFQRQASAAVDSGNGFTFPSDLNTMIAFWDTKGWPGDKKTSNEGSGGQGSTTNAFIYRGGPYGDRDNQLTTFIQANFPGALAPGFTEYDIDFRPTRNTARNARRIVRDAVNGFIFYTDDHYANFHLYAFQNLPEVDDAAPTIPEDTFTIDNGLAPVAEELAGDPTAGGTHGGDIEPPDEVLPIEDPGASEVPWNEPLGQADEIGDTIYQQIATLLATALAIIALSHS